MDTLIRFINFILNLKIGFSVYLLKYNLFYLPLVTFINLIVILKYFYTILQIGNYKFISA